MGLQLIDEGLEIDPVWEREPYVDRFESHGLRCLMVRRAELGIWCGYVRLKSDHPLYRKSAREPLPNLQWLLQRRLGEDVDELRTNWVTLFCNAEKGGLPPNIETALSVHGGVTFVSYCNQKPFGKGYWIGFDCGHWNDLTPKIHKLFLERGTRLPSSLIGVYRDHAYARNETERLAAQLSVLRRPG